MPGKRSVASFVLLAGTSSVWAQSPPGGDVYTHFIGDWVGTDRYSQSGVFITKPLSLHITELPKNKGMLWKYVYGDGVQSKFERVTKVIGLDPGHQKMTSQAHVLDKQTFEAMGLDTFAVTGLGAFTVQWTTLERGVPVLYVGEYRLGEDELSWTWQREDRGQPLLPFGEFHLRRAPGGVNGSSKGP